VRWLRAGDLLLAWLLLLAGSAIWLPALPARAAVILAALVVLGGALVPRVRLGWRPLAGMTTVMVSRGLRPGDRAWFVHGGDADLVLVTARHGLRLVIARPGHDSAEGLSVRRTRVLLMPASESRRFSP
jgi:hypothetical protein